MSAVETMTCPVCGNEIDPDKAVQVVYRGETVYLKCGHCADRFLSKPEAFQTANPEQSGCCGGEGDHHHGEHGKRTRRSRYHGPCC